jgi:hypothetical protein
MLFLEDRLAFQGLQRFCPCWFVMALVHGAFIHVSSENEVWGYLAIASAWRGDRS